MWLGKEGWKFQGEWIIYTYDYLFILTTEQQIRQRIFYIKIKITKIFLNYLYIECGGWEGEA